ncbi:hypothetical protein [Staphylococcus caprae]|uniref:hypothetical protein n=1 Tax=Staphylococcus caprae TaxID=29380 RepID=UPI001451A806|nr:hypothetical protein [Staphylococcus caprae]QJE26650.1 hypothetical protein HHJ99_12840 [Staphylococcus caprae]HEK6547220.1 hypothetical protein [Staphylococcus aureus]
MIKQSKALLIFTNKDIEANEIGYLQLNNGKQYEIFYESVNKKQGNFKIRYQNKALDLKAYIEESELEEIQKKFNQKYWVNGVIYHEVILDKW